MIIKSLSLWHFLGFITCFQLFLTACQPGYQIAKPSTLGPAKECIPQSALAKSSQFELKSRVESLNHKYPTPIFNQVQNNSRKESKINRIPLGTKLVFMMNSQCLSQSYSKSFEYISRILTAANRKELVTLAKNPCTYAVDVSVNFQSFFQSSQTLTVNDPLAPQQSHLRALGYEDVLKTLNPENLIETHKTLVAVIDTGGSLHHEDMQGQFWVNTTEFLGVAGVDDDHNGFIDDIDGWNFDDNNNILEDKTKVAPHGSHVAGLIAAIPNNGIGVAGIAGKRSVIMTVNGIESILPGFSENPLEVVSRAIQYAIDQKAQVINLSMGTQSKSEILEAVLKQAILKGVFIVAAAGNNSLEITNTTPFSPAFYAKDLDGMVAVAATNAAFGKTTEICPFSNYSKKYVEIAAPGCDHPSQQEQLGILSTGIANNPQINYWRAEGTSMAAPMVSAAAAVIFSYLHEKSGIWPTNAAVENILKNSVFSEPLLQEKILHGGQLNLSNLIRYLNNEILKLPACM